MKPSDFYRRKIAEAAERDKAAYETMLHNNEKLFDAGGGVLGKK